MVSKLFHPLISIKHLCIRFSSKANLKGPCLVSEQPELVENDACSIICLKTTPPIACIASATGTLTHSILLNIDPEEKNKVLTSNLGNISKRLQIPLLAQEKLEFTHRRPR